MEVNNLALSTSNLTKIFDKLTAVSEVNLAIPGGQVYALIGPNGSGKTTLIKMLVGLLKPTKGSAEIYGFDIQTHPLEAKRQFAFISDNPEAYPFLSGEEFLALTGNLRGVPPSEIKNRIKDLLQIFPLGEIIKQQMVNYSRGNRQKVAFLAGLLAEPKIFIIDEPIVGLDPASIRILGQKLREFARKGGTVLFSTHILAFAKSYAERVGIMIEGKIVEEFDLTTKVAIEEIYQKLTKQQV